MLIKKFTFCALCALALPAVAGAAVHFRMKAAPAADDAADAYYHTPEGVTFSGLDKEGRMGGDFAFAPVGKWLNTQAEVKPEGADLEWSFPTAVSETGKITMSTSTSKNFQFRMRTACTAPAPVLTATSGSAMASYSLAADGIKYGEYGTWENFAVNYQPGLTTTVGQANELLSTNDANATAYLNMAMAGGVFSDITVYGFGESFYDCGDFYLQAINAFLYSEKPLTAADVAVKVFRRERTSVYYDDEVAHLTVAEFTPLSDNRYYVEFRCEGEAPFITTAMQVVVLPAEGSDAQFSPMMPLQREYRASNMGTCSLYSTFTFANKKAGLQCLDFFGTEVTNDDNTSAGFLNHWAFGVKGSYEKPAGVDDIVVDETVSGDDAVYTVTGVKAGRAADFEQLPAGIYIVNGKKILKH